MSDITIWESNIPVPDRISAIRDAVLDQARKLFLQNCAKEEEGRLVTRCPRFQDCSEYGLYAKLTGNPNADPVCLVMDTGELHEAIATLAMQILSVQMDLYTAVQVQIMDWVEQEALEKEGATGFDNAESWAKYRGVRAPRYEDRLLWKVVFPFLQAHPEATRGVGDGSLDPVARVLTSCSSSNLRYMSSHLRKVIEDEGLTQEEKVEQVRDMLIDASNMTYKDLWQSYREEVRIPPIQVYVHRNGDGTNRLRASVTDPQMNLLKAKLGVHLEIIPGATPWDGDAQASTIDGGKS